MERNIDTSNFILEKEQLLVKTGIIVKTRIIQNDSVCKEEINENESVTWYANDFVIIKHGENKFYYKQKVENTDKNGNITYSYMTTKDELWRHSLRNKFNPMKLEIENSTNYKYLGKERYNDIKCIVIKVNDNKIWIDQETGFKLKEEIYSEGVLDTIIKYKVETNVVTDKEIDLPDLKEYKFIEKE